MSTVYTGTISRVRRLPNSPSGNPQWRVWWRMGPHTMNWRTKEDSIIGHAISEELVGKQVNLTVTKGGLIDIGFVTT